MKYPYAWLLCCLFPVLTACANPPEPQAQPKTWFSLGLIAYNYTNRTIDTYSVNGAGGGNVFLSRSSAGGSKTTCCSGFSLKDPLPRQYRIQWGGDECRYTQVSSYDGTRRNDARILWREQTVSLSAADIHVPPGEEPAYFETHFYPDGHVEVAVTSRPSAPRLILPIDPDTGRRPGVPYLPERCTPAQITQPGYPELYDWIVLPDGLIENDPVFNHHNTPPAPALPRNEP
ncbi:hypothetical protein HNQ50_000095 [Silvimonas terrae]|uniref:DUF3304 domain-containing protein n=1 Tax=Silvimonas terrae TaxID=300266 RepID=A0A840R7X7_9NEIS|nr:DUF3304 domain-containing protein [Silvimonas terrae]MBB5189385.1 hypothetical protein [Silvimonas terrae]